MEETTSPYNQPEPPFVTGMAYGVLAVLGSVLGVIGSFAFSWEARSLPVAAVLLSMINLAVFRGAGWAMETKLGAVVPAVFWLVVVVVLASRRPEGDLVVTGTIPGYVFIFGGAVAALVAISWTRSARPWMVGGAVPAPGVRR